jgi:hypothetical protein
MPRSSWSAAPWVPFLGLSGVALAAVAFLVFWLDYSGGWLLGWAIGSVLAAVLILLRYVF